jgi:Flp pilus assembly protein TadG
VTTPAGTRPAGTPASTRPGAGDDGSAVIEFIAVAVVLMLPLVYLLLAVFSVQRAAFGVTEGARDAGRAVSLAGTTEAGLARARAAVAIALADQGVDAPAALWFTTGGCGAAEPSVTPVLTPGARYEVCVSLRVALPFTANRVLGGLSGAGVRVSGGYELVVAPYEPRGPT